MPLTSMRCLRVGQLAREKLSAVLSFLPLYRFWHPLCQRWPQSQEAPRLENMGLFPGLQSCSHSCTSTLGELLLRCLVPHRIAPGEFLSGGFYVQAPFLFSFTLPVELWSGRPSCGATQSFGEKLCLAQAVTAQALVYRWAGSVVCACCLTGPGTPSSLLGNWRLGIPALGLWACFKGQASSLACILQVCTQGEFLLLLVLPQLETVMTAMASTNCVVFSWHHQGRVECLFLELSASRNIHFLRVTRGGRVAWGSMGTWLASPTPNGPRLCLRSFCCCLGARLRDLTFDVNPSDPRP